MRYQYSKEDLQYIKNSRAQQKQTDERMTDKVVVISGATSGVGKAAAIRLAKGGATLVLVVRNAQKGVELANTLVEKYQANVFVEIADFADLKSVKEAGRAMALQYPVIDVLINSAGVFSTKKQMTKDGHELVFQVNHLSSFLLTLMLLENLKKSLQGRIIQVNSEGHRFGGLDTDDLNWQKRHYIGLRSYGASKTAQIMSVRILADKLKETKITVNAMHPGGVKTAIGQNNGWFYRTWQKIVVRPFLKDPKISGEALYYLSAAKELEHTTSKFFNLTIEEKPMPHALDETVAQAVWIKTYQLVGLSL